MFNTKVLTFCKMFQLFIDERKTAAIRQDNRLKKLQKIHKDQEDDLQRFVQSVSYSLQMIAMLL